MSGKPCWTLAILRVVGAVCGALPAAAAAAAVGRHHRLLFVVLNVVTPGRGAWRLPLQLLRGN